MTHVRDETSDGVVAHETRARGSARFVDTLGSYHRVFAKKLLGDFPKRSWGQVQQELFGAIADKEFMSAAAEIRIPAAFGSPGLQRGALLFSEWTPRGRVVPFHPRQV